MAKIFPDKATPFFQNTISFQGSLVSLTFVKESFDKFAFLLFLLPFSRVSVRLPLLLYKFKEKKNKNEKLSKKHESRKELCRESVINIQCISLLNKENKASEKI